MVEQNQTKHDALIAAEGAIRRIVEADKWMIATWKVEDGKLHCVDYVTWDFPSGDFDKAGRLLGNVLDDAHKPSELEPLPLATLPFTNRNQKPNPLTDLPPQLPVKMQDKKLKIRDSLDDKVTDSVEGTGDAKEPMEVIDTEPRPLREAPDGPYPPPPMPPRMKLPMPEAPPNRDTTEGKLPKEKQQENQDE